MKLCIPCGRQCADSHDTCPSCGEGSWMDLGRVPSVEPELMPVEQDRPKKAKRSRK